MLSEASYQDWLVPIRKPSGFDQPLSQALVCRFYALEVSLLANIDGRVVENETVAPFIRYEAFGYYLPLYCFVSVQDELCLRDHWEIMNTGCTVLVSILEHLAKLAKLFEILRVNDIH